MSATSPVNVTVAVAASSYTITTVPIKSPQTGDTACAQFTLNTPAPRAPHQPQRQQYPDLLGLDISRPKLNKSRDAAFDINRATLRSGIHFCGGVKAGSAILWGP